jgi:hypothetical protein
MVALAKRWGNTKRGVARSFPWPEKFFDTIFQAALFERNPSPN